MSQVILQEGGIKVKVANFLQKNHIIFFIVLLFFLGGLILMGILSVFHTASENESTALLEEIQNHFVAYQKEENKTKKASLSAKFEEELKKLIETAPVSYSLLKAYFIQGNYQVSQEKWSEAAKSFGKIFEKDPKSYLASVATTNQVMCLENDGKKKEALEVIDVFEKQFSAHPLFLPQMLFSKGRILESQNDFARSKEAFQKLCEIFPQSQWAKLARDRLIALDLTN